MVEKRVIMFGGKGGAGKTTCAGATALHYASSGLNTLVISTDPTPSLSDIFEVDSKGKFVRIVDNLQVAELGMDEVKGLWDRKFGPEVYEVFSSFVSIEYKRFVDFITSILPGLKEEFMVDYIKELARNGDYDRIVWDTAPLGQTMELLRMPGMLREHLRSAPKIYSKLKLGDRTKRPVIDIIKGWEELSKEDIEFLKREVEFNLVTIPEALAVQQLDEIFSEFQRNEFRPARLVVNNVVEESDSDFLQQKREQQQGYIRDIRRNYTMPEIVELPMLPREIKGINSLAEIGASLIS